MRTGTTRNLLLMLSVPILAAVAAGCRSGSAPDDLIQSEETTESIVFVKTTGEETLNRTWASGNLFLLSPISPDGVVTPLTNFNGASVSDPCVSFDGERILFSMRPPGDPYRNIWEIRADGSGLRQVTSGDGHDFDPLYMPDGRIMFTSSRGNEMDEYNHSPAEHLHRCNPDGSGIERLSFNQSDDFDPTLLPNGRIVYTRWDHFGTFNRFPLFATNPDGTGTFHHYGPHNRNFFHASPTGNGRLIAIESTRINEDAGPIALLKTEAGPADPPGPDFSGHWDVLTANINNGGAPWPYGAFKYPHSLGDNQFIASYTLPAATEEDTDYGLYTFSLRQTGTGTPEDPATLEIVDLTFLYNDPDMNEYDAQLVAERPTPPVIPDVLDARATAGTFVAQDIFNRSNRDGQETPRIDGEAIPRIALIAARPTRPGENREFSANQFEKRALIGFADVEPDGSFKIDVPADTPLSFAILDEHDRGVVTKRTHIYVRPGETFTCTGCHEDRTFGEPLATNPNPIAETKASQDLNIPPDQWEIINYIEDIGPVVQNKCAPCHFTGYHERTISHIDQFGALTQIVVVDTVHAPALLDLTDTLVEGGEMMAEFPRGYLNLSGEPEEEVPNYVRPAFPRRSTLVDAVLGLDSHAGAPHPAGPLALSDEEKRLFNLWVLLGAQYE